MTKTNRGRQVFYNLNLPDNKKVRFGDDEDALAYWDGSKLRIVGLARAGGDSPKTLEVSQEVLTGTAGFHQGVLVPNVNRADGQVLTTGWDGNPDQVINGVATNRANNLDGATRIGGLRAATLQARNRGTNLSWIETLQLNARNDSGKNISQLIAQKIICENYGNVFTETIGLRIQMLDENVTQSQERVPLVLENIDQSAQAAATAAIKVKHTSTNGFAAFLKVNATSGDGVATRTGSPGTPAYAMLINIAGVLHYVPAYVAAQFAA